MQPTPRRKPGGQPGNANALKHGYYARRIPPAEVAALAKIDPVDLSGELQVIRYLIALITERARDVQDPALAVSMLRAISLAAITLARIQRTQQIIAASAPDDQLAEAINAALAEIMAEYQLGPLATPAEIETRVAEIRADRPAAPTGGLHTPHSFRPVSPIGRPVNPIAPATLAPSEPPGKSVSPSALEAAASDPLIPGP